MRYILVGGVPFIAYTGTGTFTALRTVDSDDCLTKIKEKISKMYDECGGLMIIIDTHTGKEV